MGKLYDRIYVSLRLLPFLPKRVCCCGTCHVHPPLPLCTSFQITDLSNFKLSVRTNSTSSQLLSPTVSPATAMFLCWQHFGMMLTSPRGTGGYCIRLDGSDLHKEVVSHHALYIAAPSFLFLIQEYHQLDQSGVYAQIVFNRTTDDVTQFEMRESRPAFTPSWILIVTWDHVMPVFYHTINSSEVKLEKHSFSFISIDMPPALKPRVLANLSITDQHFPVCPDHRRRALICLTAVRGNGMGSRPEALPRCYHWIYGWKITACRAHCAHR